MPDRGLFWSPVPDWPRADIQHQGLGITARSVENGWLVSGDLSRFLGRRAGLFCVGPLEVCERESYGLRLAPDRLLFVGRDAALIHPEQFGWSEDGIAVTDVSDGFMLFDVAGPGAPDLMALGAQYDFQAKPGAQAESASMMFAGLKVAIARIPPGWRLHVERPYATALWQWLQHAAQEWAKPPARQPRKPEPAQTLGTE
jgi:sarcosine oxidase, subunit gamma